MVLFIVHESSRCTIPGELCGVSYLILASTLQGFVPIHRGRVWISREFSDPSFQVLGRGRGEGRRLGVTASLCLSLSATSLPGDTTGSAPVASQAPVTSSPSHHSGRRSCWSVTWDQHPPRFPLHPEESRTYISFYKLDPPPDGEPSPSNPRHTVACMFSACTANCTDLRRGLSPRTRAPRRACPSSLWGHRGAGKTRTESLYLSSSSIIPPSFNTNGCIWF